MCVHNRNIQICAFLTELCVDHYCVPIAVYHHEPSRRKLIELGIKIKLLISTTTQSHSMHVCAISSCMYHIICELFATNMCTAYQDIVYF